MAPFDAYQAAYDQADKEHKSAMAERTVLDRRITHLKQTMATLLRLMGSSMPDAVSNKGITDAVREYMSFAKNRFDHPVTIREIRDQLESVGYDFSGHKNPNASISGTLERLYEAKEVLKKRRRRDDGVTVTGYVWNGPNLDKPKKELEGRTEDK